MIVLAPPRLICPRQVQRSNNAQRQDPMITEYDDESTTSAVTPPGHHYAQTPISGPRSRCRVNWDRRPRVGGLRLCAFRQARQTLREAGAGGYEYCTRTAKENLCLYAKVGAADRRAFRYLWKRILPIKVGCCHPYW